MVVRWLILGCHSFTDAPEYLKQNKTASVQAQDLPQKWHRGVKGSQLTTGLRSRLGVLLP